MDPWIIVTSLFSAILAVFIRNVNDYIKEKLKMGKAKKLLGKEIRDNKLYLSHTVKVLKMFDDIKIVKMKDADFKNNFLDDERSKELMRALIKEADRHLNLISILVYKEIFLKSNRNFHSEQDELLHEIYFYILKVESYKSLISSDRDKIDEKRLYELYFKVFEISNIVLSLCEKELINRMLETTNECATSHELKTIEQTSIKKKESSNEWFS